MSNSTPRGIGGPLARRVLAATTGVALCGALLALPISEASALPAGQVVSDTAAPVVGGLTTNGRSNPLGIGGADPAFGWATSSARRGVTQSAYELRVGSSAGASDVWNPGKRTSDDQTDVAYEGPGLASGTRYFWQVRVWDDRGVASDWSSPSSFETGLLSAGDWGQASWVGKPAPSYAAWTDYTASYDFELNSIAFGTYLRAADVNNALMFQVNVGDSAGSIPTFRPHVRVNGGFALLGEVDLRPFGFTRQGLLTGTHAIAFTVTGKTVQTSIDSKVVDTRTVQSTPDSGRVGVRTFGGESVDISNLKVVTSNGSTLASPTFVGSNPFNAGTVNSGTATISGSIDALLSGPENNAPLMRTTFDTSDGKTVRDARVYASARGVYEMSINGDKVGDQFLAPGYTEYDLRIQSQTYDVTGQIKPGANVLGAALGDGWWAGKIGLGGKYRYGTDLSMIARLKITYTDGSVQWVDTGDTTWKWAPGPFVATDNQLGEIYDAQFARDGWNKPGYDDSAWTPVVTYESATSRLAPQPDEPVRQTQVLATREVTTPGPGLTVYDLGQNMVGVPRVTITGTAGETVKIRHAEVLNRDGSLYIDNLRAAISTDYYTFAKSGTVTYQPTFTQHGFRFIEISGLEQPPAAADVKGVVLGSDLPTTGTLTTSDAMLNQLTSNVSWGARGNFLSIPTDTPARDERLGWTGDINVFGPTASYIFDTRAFLDKWMTDVRDEQYPNGEIPAVVPSSQGEFGGSGPGWEDAIVTVPYAMYRAYDNTAVVRKNWDAMTRFYDFAAGRIGADNLGAYNETFFTTTDWLSLDDTSGASNEVKTTAIWADTVRMMAEMARAIGDPRAAEYATRFAQIKKDFVAAYVGPDGSIAGGSQTGYAMALGMGLVDDAALKAKVGEKYLANLASYDFHLRTGFIGTPWLLPALSAIGRDDVAYTVLLQKDYPSWGYEIQKGATTLWERWNSIMPDGNFGDVNMNSFNHYAYGAVADWMHQNIAGIRIAGAGYRSSTIAPQPGGGLTSASGSINTVYGAIKSSWTTKAAGIEMAVTVPVGTTSTIEVPAGPSAVVTESGKALDQAPGVQSSSYDAAAHVIRIAVGSGTYSFVSTEPVSLSDVEVAYPSAGQAKVTATITNNTDKVLSDRLRAAQPSGWRPVAPSSSLDVAGGQSARSSIVLSVPADAAAGDYPVTLEFGGASLSTTVRVLPVAVPPTEPTLDHVDFGETQSEAAHQVVGSPSSGISSEAGLTRRYANNNNPGSFYTARVKVNPGEPFVLRARETWNSPGTKDYDVYVDDVLVKHVRADRSEGGQGVTSYQFLVDQPDAIDNPGTVTVKFTYPSSNPARAFYDPSIADLWVIASPDVIKPSVSAAPITGVAQGRNGFYTGPVTVSLDASDDRSSPKVEVRTDGGAWMAYSGPFSAPEGSHVLEYRASDAAGNVSETKSLTVKVDTVNPTAQASVSPNRVLTVAGTDANLATVEYRIDQGPWTAFSSPVSLNDAPQTVFFRAIDQAGRESAVGSVNVPAASSGSQPATPSAPVETGNTSAVPGVQVAVPSTVGAKVVRKRQVKGKGRRAIVRFTVTSAAVVPGSLVIRDGDKDVATVTVTSRGQLTYRLPRSASSGKHKISAVFTAPGIVTSSSPVVVLKVIRR